MTPHVITLKDPHALEGWRQAARICLYRNLPPEQVLWQEAPSEEGTTIPDLFAAPAAPAGGGAETADDPSGPRPAFAVPAAFLDLAEDGMRHTAPDRYALLYRVLWRLVHVDRNLLRIKSDREVGRLLTLQRQVQRDAYRIRAFARFRTPEDQPEQLVCFYTPEYHTLDLALPFFVNRLRDVCWTLATPHAIARWDTHTLSVEKVSHTRSQTSETDPMEQNWLTYYASTFIPARASGTRPPRSLPKKYWPNLPESHLIQTLLSGGSV